MEFVSVLVRTLKPGVTYDEFLNAWYPDHGFDMAMGGPNLARNVNDEREVLTFASFELEDLHGLDEMLTQLVTHERVRHDRVEELIESTAVRGIYEVVDQYDFSTDESVADNRPAGLDR